VCHSKNTKFFLGDMIDDAIWEPTENIAPAIAAKYSTDQRIGQNEIGRSFKLSHKCEPKLGIRL
jgi:hypothetical protein